MATLVGALALLAVAVGDPVEVIAQEAGVDVTDLQGAVNTTGLEPRKYLQSVGELPLPFVPPAPTTPTYGVWDRLAECESGGKWTTNTGNGYYGGLQFLVGTWRANGGTGMPHLASKAEQVRVAKVVQARYGWGQWPVCSRRLGLR